jgi:isopentenyldiphosphate isomerase
MEYLDIVDENNNLTGEVLSKKQAHKMGKLHRKVHIWALNNNKELLLQKRSFINKTNQNLWDVSAGGHISTGESVIDGALRELREEIGVVAKEDELINVAIVKKDINPQNKEFIYIFIIMTSLSEDDFIFIDKEVSEVKYIYYKDLEKDVASGREDLIKHDQEYSELFKYLDKRFDNLQEFAK